jgi:hypothetical protein
MTNSEDTRSARRFPGLLIGAAIASIVVVGGGLQAQDGKEVGRRLSLIVISLKTAAGPASHCSNGTLASAYFTGPRSVSAYYAENSYGLLNISGTVAGPYVVSLAEGWNPRSLTDEADSVATAEGVDLTRYSHKVYVLPREADPNPIPSGWGGQRVGSRLLVRDFWCSSRWLAAHELGHGFGVNHASTPADEYGDFSSAMGGRIDPTSDPSTWNTLPHFNAPGKIAAGWLPEGAVQTVTAAGRFNVASVETVPRPGQIQVLRIKAANEGTDYYYVSFRQRVGFSSVLTPQYASTTSVTRWNGMIGGKTCLVATLADGQAFSDASGVMVAQSSHDARQAYVTITFGAAALSNARVTCP